MAKADRWQRAQARRFGSFAGLAFLGVLQTACAQGIPLPDVPPASSIPELEARVDQGAEDVVTLVRLGAAYRAVERSEEAIPLLERARRLDPDEPSVWFFLGLAYTDVDRPAEAVSAYESFTRFLPPGSVRDHIEARIRLLRREELRVAVREAIRNEEELRGGRPPDASTLAVLPFLFESPNQELRPLRRALASMLATDLSQSGRVTVVERMHVQALMDEIALGQSGRIDPATAARGGYLVGAGRIVHGRMEGTEERLRLEATIVPVEDPGIEGPPIEEVDALDGLFDMETRMAFEIFEAMGVSLTAAERERVNRRPTESLQALLAFGQGLEAESAGRYAEAAERFARAAALDPGFREARVEAAESRALADEAAIPLEETIEIVDLDVPDVDLGVEAVLDQVGERDPIQEATGSEGVGRQDLRTRLRIVFPRPGGGR